VTSVLLEDRAVIVVGGEEAGEFLDRILTNNVSDLEAGVGRFAALLSPQGKVLADVILTRARNEAFLIVAKASVAGDLLKRLTLYRLRSRVTMSVCSRSAPLQENATLALPASNLFPHFTIEAEGTVHAEISGMAAFNSLRIAAAVPEGGVDFIHGDAFPHEINMDRLGGIDFHKGCYVGQEIVSRTEHRGSARTRTMRISYASGYGPEPGASVMAGERVIGTAGLSVAGEGLAMIRLDKLADALAAGEAISAGGILAIISAPPYAPDFMPKTAA
jgi:tRNA-modifying protein YgfZ